MAGTISRNIRKLNINFATVTFFKEHIQHKFPSDNFVFDVIRTKKDKVILIDFNPFGETTDPLFFTWDELTQSCDNNIEDDRNFELR